MVTQKRCPFCGAASYMVSVLSWQKKFWIFKRTEYGVRCNACGSTLRKFGFFRKFRTEKEAVKVWNEISSIHECETFTLTEEQREDLHRRYSKEHEDE